MEKGVKSHREDQSGVSRNLRKPMDPSLQPLNNFTSARSALLRQTFGGTRKKSWSTDNNNNNNNATTPGVRRERKAQTFKLLKLQTTAKRKSNQHGKTDKLHVSKPTLSTPSRLFSRLPRGTPHMLHDSIFPCWGEGGTIHVKDAMQPATFSCNEMARLSHKG